MKKRELLLKKHRTSLQSDFVDMKGKQICIHTFSLIKSGSMGRNSDMNMENHYIFMGLIKVQFYLELDTFAEFK